MPAYRTQDTPATYIIDYRDHLNYLDDSLRQVGEAPPTLFHGGQDMAYMPRVGASDFRSGKDEKVQGRMSWAFPISPEEATRRREQSRRWTTGLHEAGVETVIPYVCNQTIGGDPDARTGLWWFYDRWDQYPDAGPKPRTDPIEWMQREPDGRLHFNYPYRFVRTSPPLRFAPCPNNPYWHEWLRHTVRLLAEDGFDGVFVDNNILHCRCQYCEREFRTYLAETYSPATLRRRFGTDDVASLRLATRGDKVLWACAQPGYARHLKESDPDQFREKFGTDDPDAAVLSEAGNGFHWGRAHDFWVASLRARFGEDETRRILREGDLAGLDVTAPAERCLWADTQMFWAWSIGRRNADLRAAAEEVRPGFLIVPNWGDMSGFRHTDSRRLEAKNVRLWKPGADVVFFEEEYYPGTLAPGYTFDLIIPYRYAAACGMRSCALPYRGSGSRALVELATAEAAAWAGDGMFVQSGYRFPEVRRAYREFWNRYPHWFARRTSYAEVGLALSFDEVHLENTYHLREAYSLARFLADHHILFDFIPEGGITRDELRRFRVVIIPHMQFLPNPARAALAAYVEAGGRLLVTGNTGAYDEHARPVRRRDLIGRLRALMGSGTRVEYHGRGGVVWTRDVLSLLPRRAWQMHDLADLPVEKLRAALPEIVQAARDEPRDDARLARLLDDLAGRQLAVLGPSAPPTLRAAAWLRGGRKASLVLHLVNYDAPAADIDEERGRVTPVEDVAVALPVPEGMKVSRVVAADPWRPDPEPLPFRVRQGRVRFVVPRVEAGLVVRIG